MPRILLLSLLLVTLLAGCSSLRFPGVYRIDIPQGNVVTEEMLAELEPGMSPEQVRFVLGPPTLTDPFTPDTWYYLLHYQPGNDELVSQEIVVHFEGGQYTRYQGGATEEVRERTSGRRDRELEQRARDRRGADPSDPPPEEPSSTGGGGGGTPPPAEPGPSTGGSQPGAPSPAPGGI